jgi:hypothetical protein
MAHSGLIVHPAFAREADLKTRATPRGDGAYGIAGEQTVKSWGTVESLTRTRCEHALHYGEEQND